ncbi:hypothetical protein ACFSSF_11910 [Dietzia aerolata]|uniref:hypothetical protein n=1 Tax=Dietzia aerolata TaxID=595984 RepID=UPI00362DEEA1
MAPNVTPFRPRGGRRGDKHHHGKRPALWQAATGAAAVAALIVGGLSVAAHSAMPGDPLWGVSKTIFSDRAGEVELVNDLSEYLAKADDAAREGDHGEAERLLDEVSNRLDEVENASERVELMKRRDAIRRDLSRVTPSAVPSPAPAPEPAPTSGGPATLVPGAPGPVPTDLVPQPAPGVPVIPLPLDGLQISTTLQIPLDTQRIQDFLNPTTGRDKAPLDEERSFSRRRHRPAPRSPRCPPRPSSRSRALSRLLRRTTAARVRRRPTRHVASSSWARRCSARRRRGRLTELSTAHGPAPNLSARFGAGPCVVCVWRQRRQFSLRGGRMARAASA